MFTGIVTAVGEVEAVERLPGLLRLFIASPYDPAGVEIGASIAHDGCCLTVVETERRQGGMRHVVEVAPESLARTTLGALQAGDKVNLERSLRVGEFSLIWSIHQVLWPLHRLRPVQRPRDVSNDQYQQPP